MNSSSAIEKKWYLVACAPKQVKSAQYNLLSQGFTIYLPLECSHSESIDSSAPLFHRYLFIQLDRCFDNWMLVRTTPCVSGLVSLGHPHSSLLEVPNYIIDSLHSREAESHQQEAFHGRQLVNSLFSVNNGVERSMLLFETLTKELQIIHETETVEHLESAYR